MFTGFVPHLFLILYPGFFPASSSCLLPPPPPLCHTPSFTHHLSHTISHTHTHLCQPPSFTHHLSHTVFYMALGDVYPRFAWQAWHLWHWAGSGGALGPDWSPVTPRHFAWQAWHLATSTFVLRGRRGTWRHPPSFCVAGDGRGLYMGS